MAQWRLWRRDDNGNQYLIQASEDRMAVLARLLAFEAGHHHKQLYWLTGPAEPTLRTNRDLYVRLLAIGRQLRAGGRDLATFLCAWWHLSRPLADRERLDLDTVAAMILAAATVDPPTWPAGWRTENVDAPQGGYRGWVQVIRSQAADLADFTDAGPTDPMAYFGVDAPRPAGAVRATWIRWYNFDPATYLECGAAGALGGWDEDDSVRIATPGESVEFKGNPDPGLVSLTDLSWDDLAELAVCGQTYE